VDCDVLRSDKWGENGQFLVVTFGAIHDSPGAWLSVLAYRCGEHYESVFAENFGPCGGGLIVSTDSTFDVVTGVWCPEDPGCCPSPGASAITNGTTARSGSS
jgi:hypothetical protein